MVSEIRVRCRARRCKGMRRLTRELCDRCWTRVPHELRRAILRMGTQGLDARGSRRLSEKIDEAIRIAGEGIGV